MEKHEKKSLVQPYAGGCRSALSRPLGMLRLQRDVVSRRDTCQIQDGGVMSGGSVPKDVCVSRVISGIYPRSGVAEKSSFDVV